MPLGANKAAIFGVSGVSGDNYFGSDADGSLTTSGNVTYTVANKVGSYDGDMVVKNYSSLTVSAGDTITVDAPCRGLLIYVSGNCTVNGTISMQDKGPSADPTASGGSDSSAVNASGLQLPMYTSGSVSLSAATFDGCGTTAVNAVANGPSSGIGTIFSISRDGAAGATGTSSGFGHQSGAAGTNGTTGAAAISTGGGGSGGASSYGGTANAGGGGKGSCFGGGSGGGGSFTANGSNNGSAGADYGGAGGNAGSNAGKGAGGGAGNPGGSGAVAGTSGQTGMGGLIWLVVGGDLTFGTSGSLDVDSTKSGGNGHSDYSNSAGGGSSGGGAIMLLYKGTLTDNTSGTIESVSGGAVNYKGGAGGTGGFHSAQVS